MVAFAFMRLLAFFLFATLLVAQTNRGSITGIVSDSSGGVIPKASVTIISKGTGESRKVKTSASGDYAVQDLEPVAYRVEVEAAGFGKAVADDIKVDTAATATVNFKLKPGTVASEISVSAAAAAVNTESGTAGQTISAEQIDNSPLVNRSVLDLALLVPNVAGDAGTEDPGVGAGGAAPGYNLNLNGGRAGSTLIMADGANNTGVGVARAVVSFSPETVQEFSVQTSAYSAEYGRTGGGVINATTKSGTNQLHGTALWYTRNPATNAAPFTTASTNRPVSNTRNNQFSLTAGGPVVIPKVYNGRNKTFFFGAVEPRYLTDHVQVDSLLPTPAMRNGDFSNTVRVPSSNGDLVPVLSNVAAQFPSVTVSDGTIYQYFAASGNQLTILPAPASGKTLNPFPNNTIPASLLDPVSQKLLQYVLPGGDYFLDPNGYLANHVQQRFLKDNNTRYTARIDHQISDANRLNFRATIVPVVGVTGFEASNPVNGASGNYSNSKQFTLADTHIFTATVVNDLRVNYTRGRFSNTFSPQWDVKTGQNLSTELGLPSLTKGGLPVINNGLGTYGSIGEGGSILGDDVEERYNVADSVYITRGRMSLKLGVDLTHELLNTVNYLYSAGGTYNFRPYETSSNGTKSGTGGDQFASFLLGVPDAVTLNNALLPYYYRWNSGAAYLQNDWKILPNLTLNLGLRYQLQLPRTEKYNHQGSFEPQLAQSFPLSTPVTLLTGQTITSALVPPFAFSGVGGNSRYLWPADYKDFEPRFGFAWSPHLGLLRGGHLVVRGGYGLSHSPLNGQNRQPLPNFSSPATTFGVNSGQTYAGYAMRLSSNPPLDPALSWAQVLNPAANGLTYLGSINYSSQAFAISPNMHTPYAQNWNLTLSFQPTAKDVIEIAYVGNKGTHLFMPNENTNATNLDLINALNNNNLSATTTVKDPLGRTSNAGASLSVQQGTLGSTYLGFVNLYTRWDASADSIRHAGYINWVRRNAHGMTLTANYTYGKSIDDASDASPEGATLTTPTSITAGESSFGGSRRLDRAVSTFDIKHNLVSSVLYELPFGRGKAILPRMPAVLNAMFGNWAVSGIGRMRTGYPFEPVIRDNNGLGDNSSSSEYSMRPNLISGVPVVNPLWSPSCPVTTQCQPYLNPAAFERPALGTLGNAPRTIDGARGPLQKFFDFSAQKNFPLHEGRFRIQLRVDLLNAFNHPNFGVPSGYGGGEDLFSAAPSTAVISAASYDSWAKANSQPLSTTAAGAANLALVQSFVTGARNAKGALPADFFTVPLPTGFSSAQANSFNILTPGGYKLYALKNVYDGNFGALSVKSSPRYIQFGLKIYF